MHTCPNEKAKRHMVGQDTAQTQNASFNPFDPYAAGQQLGRDMTGQTQQQTQQPSTAATISENVASTTKWLVIGGIVVGAVWLYAAMNTANSNLKFGSRLASKVL